MRKFKGCTFYICFGRWANPHVEMNRLVPFRLAIGWVSLTIVRVDIEVLIQALIEDNG